MIPPELENYAREDPQALIDHVNACITALTQANPSHPPHVLLQALLQRTEVNSIQTRLVVEMFKKTTTSCNVIGEKENANPRSSFYSTHNVFSSIGKRRVDQSNDQEVTMERVLEGLDNATCHIKQMLSNLNESNTRSNLLLNASRKSLISLKASLSSLKESFAGVGDDLVLDEFMDDVRLLKEAAVFYLQQSMNLVDDRHVFKQRLLLLLENFREVKSELVALSSFEPFDQSMFSGLRSLIASSFEKNKKDIQSLQLAHVKDIQSLLLAQVRRLETLSRMPVIDETSDESIDGVTISFEKIQELKLAMERKLGMKERQIENWREECANMEKSFQGRLCHLQEALDRERAESDSLRRNIEVMERTNRTNISQLLSENEQLQKRLQQIKLESIKSEISEAKQVEQEVSEEAEGKKRKVEKEELMIGFAGFSQSQRDEMAKNAKGIGFPTYIGNDFSQRMTHLVCPEGYVSLRVLAAAVSCKWLVPPEWLQACTSTGHRVAETEHGGRKHKVSPLQGQFFSLTPSFEEVLGSERMQKLHNLRPPINKQMFTELIVNLGKARLVGIGQGIPLIFCDQTTNNNYTNSTNSNTNSSSNSEGMSWKDLIKLIMNF